MSDEIEIKLPKLGESIVSATIVQWFKKVGDFVELDEPLLEVATDKVNSEIPSPVAGVITKIVAAVDQELDVGAPLAWIATGDARACAESKREMKKPKKEKALPPSRKNFYTPVVLKIAQQEGIALTDLANIPATGAGGRLSKKDLEKYLAAKVSRIDSSEKDEERVAMSPMRKMVADAMVRSFYTAPHATLVSEVDVTSLVTHLAAVKEQFFRDNGYKITVTSYLARAISRAAQKYPMVNASLDQETIVLKKKVHLGIAVNIDQGIVVPVINQCDQLSIKEIARMLADLSAKARTGTLHPDQVQGGTLTMTNFGMSGAIIGTPIIRQPEVAIVGVGAIAKRVVALPGDVIGIRSLLHLSLSFDHRVIDGIYGCGFLAEIKQLLEEDL